ncbi:DinB family protein [Saccharopolyspora sp. NPDC047091]|uniref:DinB family protein n=1 Tax=Saccharopolyspora sp. NPDC047091 TaxID=3155924 RepID=UPI0033D81C53
MTTTLDAERTDLLAQLDAARKALITTTDGLDDEQLGLRPTASELCLGGLIKHVASVEANWLRFILEGTSAMAVELPDGVTWEDLMAGTATTLPQRMIEFREEFRMQPEDTLAGVLARYAEVAARTAEVVSSLPDLNLAHPLPEVPWNPPGEVRSARRVLMHVIAETAQHAGHADILRESIDGRRGF